jgi:hypothetical protein
MNAIWNLWVTNCSVIVIGICLVLLMFRVRRIEKGFDQALDLILAENVRKQAHTDAFKKLTDVDSIVEDMERGADVMEARNANRLTKPREDAGPPARVYRPRLRSKLPSPWTPKS